MIHSEKSFVSSVVSILETCSFNLANSPFSEQTSLHAQFSHTANVCFTPSHPPLIVPDIFIPFCCFITVSLSPNALRNCFAVFKHIKVSVQFYKIIFGIIAFRIFFAPFNGFGFTYISQADGLLYKRISVHFPLLCHSFINLLNILNF